MSEFFFKSICVAQPVAVMAAKASAATFLSKVISMSCSRLVLKADFKCRRRILFRDTDRSRAGVLGRALRIDVDCEVVVVARGVDGADAVDFGGITTTLTTACHTTVGDRVVVDSAIVRVVRDPLQLTESHQKVVVRLRVLERTLRHRGIPHTVTPGWCCIFSAKTEDTDTAKNSSQYF